MRKLLALMVAVLLVSFTGVALAKVSSGPPSLRNITRASQSDWLDTDNRAGVQGAAKTDTVSFGYYTIGAGGLPYAVLGGTWNFDHGAADPLEGWTSNDLTANDQTYWRQMTQAKWIAEGGVIGWPAMTGNGMVLCGATEGHADSLGWVDGRGYGNDWCQRLTSPALVYDGTGTEDLSLNYFSESELDYDYTKIWVESSLGSRVMINSPGFNGKIGIDTITGVITPPEVSPTRRRSRTSTSAAAPPSARSSIVVEFESDGGLSDEDNDGPGADSFYGGVGMDDIGLTGTNLVPPGPVSYGFETDLQGWTASMCPGVGSFMGVANRDDYTITDPCACALTGKVLEMHDDVRRCTRSGRTRSCSIADRRPDDDSGQLPGLQPDHGRVGPVRRHAAGQRRLLSARLDVLSVREPPGAGPDPVVASHRAEHLVLLRGHPCLRGTRPPFYGPEHRDRLGTPHECPAGQVRLRVSGDCDAFGVDPCSGVTNFTPIIDNITGSQRRLRQRAGVPSTSRARVPGRLRPERARHAEHHRPGQLRHRL